VPLPTAVPDRLAPTTTAALSTACVVLGAASIVGSVATWAAARGDTSEERAHAERFGIFIGLWAPTFFVLADIFGRPAAAASAAAAARA
jgi:hypothetical protein